MRKIFNLLLLVTGVAALVSSCDKMNDLPLYGAGTAVTLSSSATAVAPAPADSNNTALTLNWTLANHATDSGKVKYIIQFDTTGRNFANPTEFVVNGALSSAFTAKQLNNMLLARGYAFNVPVDMDVRVISSY